MNQDAALLVRRHEQRKRTLSSLRAKQHGLFVAKDVSTGLFHGKVHGVFALVFLEHADVLSQPDLSIIAHRGLNDFTEGLTPLATAISEEMELLEAEMAWVKECG